MLAVCNQARRARESSKRVMVLHGRKTRMMPGFGISVEFVTCLWITCAILTLVASDRTFYPQRIGKRLELREEPFIPGSRYGRSGGQGKNGNAMPKLVEIVPRMDRFFWGSRYGKRVPLQYQSASSLNRFTAVLDYMDRENEMENDRGHGEPRSTEEDLNVIS